LHFCIEYIISFKSEADHSARLHSVKDILCDRM
jgi:hypothetical protein